MLPKEDFNYVPQGFDRIGDIVIIEIKDRLKKFENEIGLAILSSNPSVKTVYIKDSKVYGAQRLQKLRYIAGQEKYKTIHRE
ncbi:MAG: tRNA (guanine-N1)-methyltransferase, partial [Candidatus Aenigmarchaeota archaeon]|nr:tRNA (guanine-N1)-methyltransferase [Candidatus Aenigmarchaeota archaeon]